MESKIQEWKEYLDKEVANTIFVASIGVLSAPEQYKAPICFALFFFILLQTRERGKFLRDLNKLKKLNHNPLIKLRFKRLTKPLSFKSLVFSGSTFLFSILCLAFAYYTGM